MPASPLLQARLPRLLELARDPSEPGRQILASLLIETFLQSGFSLSPREKELLDDILHELIGQGSVSVRQQLSRGLGKTKHLPPPLAKFLAKEDIKIAGPVLRDNPHLDDPTLLEIVQEQSRAHALAIAQRNEISMAVADALLVTKDTAVVEVLLGNLGAELSAKGVELVGEMARRETQLQSLLLARPEVSPDQARGLYWWLLPELKRQLLSRFGYSQGALDDTLEQEIQRLLQRHAPYEPDTADWRRICSWIAERQTVSVRLLMQILRMGHTRLFTALLAEAFKLDDYAIELVVNEVGGAMLAVLSRNLDCDKPGFASLFLLTRATRAGEQVVDPSELASALKTFDRITLAEARSLLHSWQQDPSYIYNRGQSAQSIGAQGTDILAAPTTAPH